MNTPNKLTILRIILAFICVGLILKNTLISIILALVVFGLASLTDFFDGYIARKYNLISDLGKILDPIADKVLILGVFFSFFCLGIVNFWMVILIAIRELLLTVVRLFNLRKGVVQDAEIIGKHKTVAQIVGILIIFLIKILSESIPSNEIVIFLFNKFIPVLMLYIVGITVFSGIIYFRKNRAILNK